MSQIPYRPEVDGLRAVAVLPVILFHAGLPGFGGGYIGVDVFFVISGYLITSLILKEMRDGTFSLINFWERRARRILPALTVVLAATLIAAWFIFLPLDYKSLGKQAMAQSLFSSNMLFYSMLDYFAPDHEAIPLLHTWSLAVEEQFYVLFPLVMLFLWNRVREGVGLILLAAAVLLLCTGIWGAWKMPSAAFYLLPFRAWELLTGSLLAFWAWPEKFGPHSRNGAGFFGLILIGASVLFYTKDTPFPGAAAIPPCLGAALIILSASQATAAGRFLSLKPVVFAGKISYSWYLWHWPVFMLAKYQPVAEYTATLRVFLIVLSFAIAVLSWKYIEAPFRTRRIAATTRAMYLWALAGIVMIGGAGFVIYHSNGVPARVDPQVALYDADQHSVNIRRDECVRYRGDEVAADNVCEANEGSNIAPGFVMWGDSFGDAAAPAFSDLSKKYNRNGYVVFQHACPPILDHDRTDWAYGERCLTFNREMFAFIKRHKIKHVFLVGNWNGWLRRKSFTFGDESWLPAMLPTFGLPVKAGLQHTIDLLNGEGITVYLVLPPPAYEKSVPRILALYTHFGLSVDDFKLSAEAVRKAQAETTDIFVEYNRGNSRLRIVDPTDAFCPSGGPCVLARDGHSLYYNKNHLSNHGARLLGEMIDPVFAKGF